MGSKRCHDLTENTCLLPQLGSGPDSNNLGSGHFTRDDYIDILKYAKARQIEVIPEIDMPAHARAAVVSMEARYNNLMKQGKEKEANEFRLVDPTDDSNTTSVQFYERKSYLNPCLDSSKRFVDKVIGEMAQMHKEAGMPLNTWHFGGDEAKNIRLGAGFQDKNGTIEPGKGIIDKSIEDKPWAKSQVCQDMVKQGKIQDVEHLSSHFAIEVSKLVNAHGIEKMQAWQDGLKDAKSSKDFATKRVGVNFWDTLYWGGPIQSMIGPIKAMKWSRRIRIMSTSTCHMKLTQMSAAITGRHASATKLRSLVSRRITCHKTRKPRSTVTVIILVLKVINLGRVCTVFPVNHGMKQYELMNKWNT